ncbi:DctP family TRAP transporter solute-binding subunit [Murdochiella vaginalis]|uniref:DctP family TRAP transporter solute-binding subunit n=1 Tax=Murdochiella vaginalis TaxID=1852373 RepID=UPI0008FE2C9C|nr:DctP family TRAP transporter solute-binding subunit [Murdochiella vaginalis]
MKQIRKILTAGLIFSMLLLVACQGNGGKPGEKEVSSPKKENDSITLRVASVVSQSAKDAAEIFTKEVAEKTDGRIQVKFFHDNQLGDDKAVVESTQMGDIDMAISPITPLASFFDDFFLFDAPFIFSDYQEVYDVLDGEVGQGMMRDLEQFKLKVLGFGENGFRYLTNNKLPVKSPDDLKGLKIRVMENEIQLKTWEALGANPTPMSFNELYTALQQNTVDGEENSLGIIDSSQFMTVQKYLTLDKHTYVPFVFCMNLDKFNELSKEDQAVLLEAGKTWVKNQREFSQKYDHSILEKYQKDDQLEVIDISSDEQAVWKKKIEDAGIYKLIREKLSHPEYLDTILK